MSDLVTLTELLTEDVSEGTMTCLVCNARLAESWEGLRHHYELKHPETRPKETKPLSLAEIAKLSRKALIKRVEKKYGEHNFFGKGAEDQ